MLMHQKRTGLHKNISSSIREVLHIFDLNNFIGKQDFHLVAEQGGVG